MYAENELWELAERALEGSLPANEQHSLDQFLAADPAAAALHTERLAILRSMKEQGRRLRFRQSLKNIHATLPQAKAPVYTRVIPFVQRHARTMAMAASVALVTSMITVATMRQTAKPPQVAPGYRELRREVNNLRAKTDKHENEIKDIAANQKAADNSTKPAVPQPGDYTGTGFAITNDGYLLTNYHVAEGADSIYIQTRDGRYHKARVYAYEKEADMAVLKVEDDKFRFGKSDVPYTFSTSRSELGERIYTMGFPQDEVVYNEGYIASAHGYSGDTAQYRLDVSSSPGQSGAPVLNASGAVIGMITGNDFTQSGVTYAITSRTMLHLLASIPKNKRLSPPRANHLTSDRRQQIKRLEEYTCMIQVYKSR